MARRSRRRRVVVGLVVVTVVWVLTAVVPLWQYAEARTVPSGAQTSQATVVGFDRVRRVGSTSRSGNRGKIVRVELVDGTEDTVHLGYRLDYPEVGDTLTVYREDGELRSTAEGSLFQLVVGALLLVAWPAATIAYLRHLRRRVAGSRP